MNKKANGISYDIFIFNKTFHSTFFLFPALRFVLRSLQLHIFCFFFLLNFCYFRCRCCCYYRSTQFQLFSYPIAFPSIQFVQLHRFKLESFTIIEYILINIFSKEKKNRNIEKFNKERLFPSICVSNFWPTQVFSEGKKKHKKIIIFYNIETIPFAWEHTTLFLFLHNKFKKISFNIFCIFACEWKWSASNNRNNSIRIFKRKIYF